MDEERIRLMTKLATYEQNRGQENMAINQFYRRDYVALQMIKAFVCSTIAFGILILLYVLYQMDELTALLYRIDYHSYLVRLVILYAVFTIVFQAIAFAVSTYRYRRAHREQKQFLSRLKKVARLCESEETGGQL